MPTLPLRKRSACTIRALGLVPRQTASACLGGARGYMCSQPAHPAHHASATRARQRRDVRTLNASMTPAARGCHRPMGNGASAPDRITDSGYRFWGRNSTAAGPLWSGVPSLPRRVSASLGCLRVADRRSECARHVPRPCGWRSVLRWLPPLLHCPHSPQPNRGRRSAT